MSYPKEEEYVECYDCGKLSQLFEKRQGVSMGGVVIDCSIGDCCRPWDFEEEEETKKEQEKTKEEKKKKIFVIKSA